VECGFGYLTASFTEQNIVKNHWQANLFLLVSALVAAFAGLPATFWAWHSQRRQHPFIDRHGKRAWQGQYLMSILFLALFSLTTIVVIPSCAETAHYYTSPKDEYIFSWVAGWILLESLGGLFFLSLPFSFISALQAYGGKM